MTAASFDIQRVQRARKAVLAIGIFGVIAVSVMTRSAVALNTSPSPPMEHTAQSTNCGRRRTGLLACCRGPTARESS